MKVAILTTDTLHHTYFVKKITETFKIDSIIIERDFAPFKYHTMHRFEWIDRPEYEINRWFNTSDSPLFSMSEMFDNVYNCKNVNDQIGYFKKEKFDLGIVFGTGKVSKDVIACFKLLVNLHGGDPSKYRGLDSHLWSIYHNDFNLSVALHVVEPRLDTGGIILRRDLILPDELYKLRATTTEVCINLVKTFLIVNWNYLSSDSERSKDIDISLFSNKQPQIGRYYSAMPACLKDVVVKKYEKEIFIRKLSVVGIKGAKAGRELRSELEHIKSEFIDFGEGY